jgi:hypothetical protein
MSAANADSPPDAVPEQLARTPPLVALWRYWRSKLGGRAVLPRADFYPGDIPELLQILTLTERTPEGRLRYRIAGGKVVEAYGFEATGKYLDEFLSPDRLKVAHVHIGTALSSARPVFSRTTYASPGGPRYVNARLNIPLSDGAGAVNLVVAAHIMEISPMLGAQFGDRALVPSTDELEVL